MVAEDNDLTAPRINLATGLLENMPCKPSWSNTHGKGSIPDHSVTTRILGMPSRVGRTTTKPRNGC
ncbi:MAG: hypothetical protein ACKPKO_22645, partial [Candidatus Fonsibacter sp.]